MPSLLRRDRRARGVARVTVETRLNATVEGTKNTAHRPLARPRDAGVIRGGVTAFWHLRAVDADEFLVELERSLFHRGPLFIGK